MSFRVVHQCVTVVCSTCHICIRMITGWPQTSAATCYTLHIQFFLTTSQAGHKPQEAAPLIVFLDLRSQMSTANGTLYTFSFPPHLRKVTNHNRKCNTLHIKFLSVSVSLCLSLSLSVSLSLCLCLCLSLSLSLSLSVLCVTFCSTTAEWHHMHVYTLHLPHISKWSQTIRANTIPHTSSSSPTATSYDGYKPQQQTATLC